MKEFLEKIHDPGNLEDLSDFYLRLPPGGKKDLLTSLREIRDDSAGRFLASILPREGDKELAKEIKRLLFRLKTIGVSVEELRPAGDSVLRKIEEKKAHMGFVSNFDFENTRVVVAAFEARKNTFLFANAIIHFHAGLFDLKVMPLDLKRLQIILDRYRQTTSETVLFQEVSPGYALYLIEEGDSRSRSFADAVRDLKQFSSALNTHEGIRKPGDIYSLKAPEGVEPLLLEAVLSEPIFSPLIFSWDTLEEDRKTFSGLGASTILLPSHMIEEKKQAYLAALLERDSLKVYLPSMRRMLEDYAYLFYLSKRFGSFSTLMETLRLDTGPHSALAFFLRKALEKGEQTEQQQGIIVNPYEQIRR
jgi:hypothetical protein